MSRAFKVGDSVRFHGESYKPKDGTVLSVSEDNTILVKWSDGTQEEIGTWNHRLSPTPKIMVET